MTYNNPGTHGMPDKVESGCPLYYAALGHSYAQNCLVAASFAIPPRSRRNYLTGPAHATRTAYTVRNPLSPSRRISLPKYRSLIFSSPGFGRREDVAGVTPSLKIGCLLLLLPPLLPSCLVLLVVK